jgi:hypothetical protein
MKNTKIHRAKKSLPCFPWPGGKAALSSEIVKYIPKKGRKFIDLCAGRGNITLRAMHEGLNYSEWILNDILTAKFFHAIKDRGDKFVAAERTQDEYDRCAELAKKDDPYALMQEPHVCFNGGTYLTNGMRGTGGGCRSANSHTRAVRRANELLRAANVRIAALDWLDCLKAEKLGSEDVVIADFPYIGCDVGAYTAESICPTEVIEYFKDAPFLWIFCEYAQPIYVQAFGEPAYKKTVQLRSCDVQKTREKRTECIWVHEPKAVRSVTRHVRPVPMERTQSYYVGLGVEELLAEIKDCLGNVDYSRNEINREMRERLLPVLLELKKRTFRKHPGFYESLALIGLNGDRVRQWFYRSNTADEAIDLLDEETDEPEPIQRSGGRCSSQEHVLLIAHGDKMAQAIAGGKTSQAKKLATQWIEARS